MHEVTTCLSNVEANCMVHRIDLIKTNAVNKSRRNIVLMSIVIFRITAGECALINPCPSPFVYFLVTMGCRLHVGFICRLFTFL